MTDRPKTWGRSHAPRLPAQGYPAGRPIHVVVCTLDRRPVFLDPTPAGPVFELCCRAPDLAAVCLMPDHLHLLHLDAERAGDSVARLKSATTRLAWELGVRGRLWQRSFYDRVLRSRERIRDVAAYITGNPVRAGLVEAEEEYPLQRTFPERFM